MSNLKRVIASTYEFLANEENWCRGAFWRDSESLPTVNIDPDVCSRCIEGALMSACKILGADQITLNNASILIANVIDPKKESVYRSNTIYGFNDSIYTTHSDVLQVLEVAMDRAA